jgi:uncharacterized membrane protein
MKSTGGSRFFFVDLFRGWAVLIMIETHVVNALLLPALKEGPLYPILTFFNGLVAPSFLFCAGFALSISLTRRWEDFIKPGKTLGRYILRLLFILLVGYTLHIPRFSLRQMMDLDDPGIWMGFWQSDILHVIALTLMALVLLVILSRTRRTFLVLASLFGLLIVFLAPVVRELDYSGAAVWFRGYLTTAFKSQFPLFPWSAFLIGGTLTGWWYLTARGAGNEAAMMQKFAIACAGAIVVALAAEIQPITFYPGHDFWRGSPEFFFVRFGVVGLLCAGLWWYEQRRVPSPVSVFSIFGQESLLVYATHLIIVYGHTFEWSFIRQFGPTLTYVECFGLFAALTVAMFILAAGWHRLKGWNTKVATGVQYALVAGIALQFILK